MSIRSEEEKEAIKYLEFLINEKCECEACQRAKKEYKTILNLIKKQQKEIEEKRIIIFAGAEKVKQLEKEIEELKKDRKDSMQVIYGGRRFGTERMVVRDYISKDKIRELRKIDNIDLIQFKIKELLEENTDE